MARKKKKKKKKVLSWESRRRRKRGKEKGEVEDYKMLSSTTPRVEMH
jgi:hypothetical protein